jgi:phytoene synthase
VLSRQNHDSITLRARTSKTQKLGWLTLAWMRAAGTLVMPRSPVLYARPLPEVAFLVEAAATQGVPQPADWSDRLLETFARLSEEDEMRRDALAQGKVRSI